MHALSPTLKQVLVHNPAQGVSPLVPASDFPTAFPSLVLVDFFPSGFWLQAHVLWPQKPLYSAHDMQNPETVWTAVPMKSWSSTDTSQLCNLGLSFLPEGRILALPC